MKLVVCMAGLNTRFHDVGIDVPKYLLPFRGQLVIQAILNNLNSSKNFEDVYLIAHERDDYFKVELAQAIETIGVNTTNILYIGETNGQAETAHEALTLLNLSDNESVVFHNADTILFDRDTDQIENILESGQGVVDVFESSLPIYSYVDMRNGNILDIVEKKVISNLASSGLYGFPNVGLYKMYFSKLTQDNMQSTTKEIYISDVIKLMLRNGLSFAAVGSTLVNQANSTLVIGSPEQYSALLGEF